MSMQNTHQSVQERAYLHVRTKILTGAFSPGEAVSEASIARELGISRGPLREAVRRLTAQGLLRQSPAGGSVVVDFSRREVAELYELREALEVYAAGKAAEHGLPPAELARAKNLLGEVINLRDELATSGEVRLGSEAMARFIRNDLQYHILLVRASANSRILKAVPTITRWTRALSMRSPSTTREAVKRPLRFSFASPR